MIEAISSLNILTLKLLNLEIITIKVAYMKMADDKNSQKKKRILPKITSLACFTNINRNVVMIEITSNPSKHKNIELIISCCITQSHDSTIHLPHITITEIGSRIKTTSIIMNGIISPNELRNLRHFVRLRSMKERILFM